jgi:hypothetical protein
MAATGPKLFELNLSDLTLDPELQGRVSLDQSAIKRYADAIRDGEKRKGDPPRVYTDGKTLWLAGGWHWYHASKEAGKDMMECEVVQGDRDDAAIFAMGDNYAQMVPRTDEDLWNVILWSLRHPKTRDLGRNERSKLCRASHCIVDRVLKAWKACPDKDKLTREVGLKILAELKAEGGLQASKTTPAAAEVPMIPADLFRVFGPDPFAEHIRFLDNLLAQCEDGWKNKKPGFGFLSIQSVRLAVQKVKDAILSADPHCVCPQCGGTRKVAGPGGPTDCTLCRANGQPVGFLSAHKWGFLSDELKASAAGLVVGRGRYSGLSPETAKA